MKERYVKDLVEGDGVDTVFALRSRELRCARTGDAYLSFELVDRTGSIRAVLFRPDASEQAIPVGSVVRVRGTVTTFRGVRRVSAVSLHAVIEYDVADLIPCGTRDLDELTDYFEYLCEEVADPRLIPVLHDVFGDTGFFDRFSVCPGAQVHHHAYAGGLLEHTVSVATLAQHVGQMYDRIDPDLLLTASLLHDIGKVDELELDPTISYSDAGRLLGHVVLGERRVAAACERTDVPKDLAMRLSHVILSHHGELEWGAPKRPCMLEAVALHHADNMDAKISGFVQAVSGASVIEERWSDVTNLFRRPLYVPRPAEDDRWRQPLEDDEYSVRSA